MSTFPNKTKARLELSSIIQQQTTKQLANIQELMNQHLRLFLSKQVKAIPPSKLAILAYQPHFSGEMNLTEICEYLNLSSKIFLPKISDNSTMKFLEKTTNHTPGKYGILEPVESIKFVVDDYELAIALIPGLGFDYSGNRLGRGLGFYDRFLANYPAPAKLIKIGVALNCQITPQLPVEDHDQKMDYLLTETGLIKITLLT